MKRKKLTPEQVLAQFEKIRTEAAYRSALEEGAELGATKALERINSCK